MIEAEIFIADGIVTVWGLMNTIRDRFTNPLLPAAYSYPLNISDSRIDLVRREIQRLIDSTGVKYGAFNIEMVITGEEKLYFLDAGPRNGGNELPEFISMIMGEDLVEATIKAAMGEFDSLKSFSLDGVNNGLWGMMVLHSDKEGVFRKVDYDEFSKQYLVRESYFKKSGDHVGAFQISRDAIGLAYFEFPNKTVRDSIMNDFQGNHIRIKVS